MSPSRFAFFLYRQFASVSWYSNRFPFKNFYQNIFLFKLIDIIEVFKFHVIIHATFFPEYFSRQKPAINIFPISTVQVGLLNEKPSTLSTELG